MHDLHDTGETAICIIHATGVLESSIPRKASCEYSPGGEHVVGLSFLSLMLVLDILEFSLS